MVPHKATRRQRVAAWTLGLLLRLLTITLRYRVSDPWGFLQKAAAGPAIFCFWHNRLLLCIEAHRFYVRHNPGSKMAALVSASRDGAFLAGILEQFNILPVRGSSSRRGPQALLELTNSAQRGYSLTITPDGPRGPCYVVQEGVISLAQLTGLPIVPFSYHTRPKLRLRSWDRFQVPLPFALCRMNIGRPIHIPRDATDEERETLRIQLETSLKELSVD